MLLLRRRRRWYKDGSRGNRSINLRWDETEGPGDHGDDFQHTIPEILISPQVHANVDGKPYAGPLNLTHSATLKTLAEIYGVPKFGHASDPGVHDLSSLLKPGAIKTAGASAVPEPSTLFTFGVGGLLLVGGIAVTRRRRSINPGPALG